MTQRDELAKVKARIRALLERTEERGSSEAEATLAATMVGKLLTQYNLSMDEIEVREQKCITRYIDSGSKNRNHTWGLMSSLATFADCKNWIQGYSGRKSCDLVVFGQEGDVLLVEYLFGIVVRAVEAEARHFKTTATYRLAMNRRQATDSFKIGMTRRIGTRLAEMRAEREAAVQEQENARRDAARAEAEERYRTENAELAADVEAILKAQRRGETLDVDQYRAINAFDCGVAEARSQATSGGSSLIVLKGQLVEVEYEKLKLKMGRPRRAKARRVNDEAIAAGRKAGDRVNLNRPLEGPVRTSGLLG